MTVNYFIECPICKSITRMRSPAGYIYSTPVRVHCGKCNTLLCGEFISDNENIKAYFEPKNCKSLDTYKYDYYGEASGELICNKIIAMEGDAKENPIPKLSPVFDFLYAMSEEDRCHFIDYACYASDLAKNWDVARIKYDLFLKNQNSFIKDKFYQEASLYGYDLNSESELFKFIYFSIFFDCGGVFKEKILKNKLYEINYRFYHLNKNALQDYLIYLEKDNRLDYIQEKLFDLISAYYQIVKFIIPAIGLDYYDDAAQIDKVTQGLTTCTFKDISHFYQNSFETLAECCEIVAGLDNIDNRLNFNLFPTKLDMQKFKTQKKGNKIKMLSQNEFFAKMFDLNSESNDLRNAIGHNDYKFDGISQTIDYFPNADKAEKKSVYLVDVALECVALIKSAIILLFCLYELKRYDFARKGNPISIHKIFFNNVKPQNHCPCGSGKKYRNCCRKLISERKKLKRPYYPVKANCSFNIK